MGYRSLVAAALGAIALAGCGSSSSSSSDASGPRSWTFAQFSRLSGIHRNSDLTYRLAGNPPCTATVILRSTAEVQTYENSGDVIVTNADRSAGIRVDPGQPPACKARFTRAMANIR